MRAAADSPVSLISCWLLIWSSDVLSSLAVPDPQHSHPRAVRSQFEVLLDACLTESICCMRPSRARGGWLTWLLSRTLASTLRSHRSSPHWWRVLTKWPFEFFTGLLRRQLGTKMLTACEVSMELAMGLTWSAQVQVGAPTCSACLPDSLLAGLLCEFLGF